MSPFRTMFKKVGTEQSPSRRRRPPRGPRPPPASTAGPTGWRMHRRELCAWAARPDAITFAGASNTEDDRFSPGERYGAVYQSTTCAASCAVSHRSVPHPGAHDDQEYELADDKPRRLIYTNQRAAGPAAAGMERRRTRAARRRRGRLLPSTFKQPGPRPRSSTSRSPLYATWPPERNL